MNAGICPFSVKDEGVVVELNELDGCKSGTEIDITGEGAIRAGECIVSGGSVRAGAGFSLYAGLSARRDAWPSCGRVVSRTRPENLLSGFWDRVPCGASA